MKRGYIPLTEEEVEFYRKLGNEILKSDLRQVAMDGVRSIHFKPCQIKALHKAFMIGEIAREKYAETR